jgi:hypothetical protein
MGRVALLALLPVMVALGTAVLLTSSTAEEPVTLVNSRNGLAVLQVADISPGESRSSEVTLQNTGSQTGELTLALTDVTDTSPGGQLSSRLLLNVEDLASRETFAAPWNAFSTQSLGRIDAGEARTFRLTVTLPNAGPDSNDDNLQGSQTRGHLRWRATTGDPVPPPEPPPGEPPSGGAPGTEPVPPVGPGPPAGRAPKIRLDLAGAQAWILTRRSLSFVVRCDERCRITAYAIVPGPGRRHIRTRTVTHPQPAHQPVRIRVPLPRDSVTRIRRKLSHQQRVSIRLVIKARDSAGNVRTITRRVNLDAKQRRSE